MENAEFWVRSEHGRIALEDFLERHNIGFNEDMKTEELRQLYVNFECGRCII